MREYLSPAVDIIACSSSNENSSYADSRNEIAIIKISELMAVRFKRQQGVDEVWLVRFLLSI
jgi:hypothetical protein